MAKYLIHASLYEVIVTLIFGIICPTQLRKHQRNFFDRTESAHENSVPYSFCRNIMLFYNPNVPDKTSMGQFDIYPTALLSYMLDIHMHRCECQKRASTKFIT